MATVDEWPTWKTQSKTWSLSKNLKIRVIQIIQKVFWNPVKTIQLKTQSTCWATHIPADVK